MEEAIAELRARLADAERRLEAASSPFQYDESTGLPTTVFFDTSLCAEDLIEASEYPPVYQFTVTGHKRKKKRPDGHYIGSKVNLNGETVAIFKYKGELYAMDARCSHAGGDISLGDIEERNGRVCISCPRHGFCFDISTGAGVAPKIYHQNVYSLRETQDGVLQVGFDALSSDAFHSSVF